MRHNAYHFTKGDRLRDGTKLPPTGTTLKHTGPIKMCSSGLHASRNVWDALKYAPGSMLHRVYCLVDLTEDDTKLVCRERTIIQTIDAEDVLRKFARMCALDVLQSWDAPDVVVEYLKTGNKSIREAANSAAYSASYYAADSASYYAADSAANSAANSASYYAADSAADSAANSAANSDTRKKQKARLIRMVNEEFRKECE